MKTLKELVEKYGYAASILHNEGGLELDEVEKMLKRGIIFCDDSFYEGIGQKLLQKDYPEFCGYIPCELEEYFDYKEYEKDALNETCKIGYIF